jgi:hypothetical protein
MPRFCFLPILPEHDLAADLLSRAANALLRHDLQEVAALLRKSDLGGLGDYRYRIAGPRNPAIHRQLKPPGYTLACCPDRAGQNLPRTLEQL